MTIYRKTIVHLRRPLFLAALILAGFVASSRAQEVFIPDPGLNAAIRQALNKPVGPLTEQDMLALSTFDARSRNVSSVPGTTDVHYREGTHSLAIVDDTLA